MAHELKHGYDRSLGQLNATTVQGNTMPFVEAEWDAVNLQNQILFNQGKALRCNYDGVEIPVDKFIAPRIDDVPPVAPTESEKSAEPATKSIILKGGGVKEITTVDEKGNATTITTTK